MQRLKGGDLRAAANVRIGNVVRMLQSKAAEVPDDKIRVGVGFSAAYAFYLHEKKEMKWKGLPRKGKYHKGFYWDPQDRAQPNFLVGPFREMREELAGIVRRVYAKTGDVEKALTVAGLRLQREAQLRVPVDFGFLKASAWTKRLS